MNTGELINALIDKLEGWAIAIVRLLPNLALAILVIFLGLLAAKVIRRFSKRQLTSFNVDKTITGFLSRILYIAVFIVGLVVALSILNLSGTVASILAGLGILGLALGFAFQDTAANFMSGIYITFKQPFAIGDVIATQNDTMGNVVDINLRVTKVKTFDGPIVYVPNRFLFEDDFTNFTESGQRRLRVACGVSYGDDLEKVENIVLEALEDTPGRIKDQEITIHWTEFGDSSIDFTANIWLDYTRENKAFVGAKNYAFKAIKKAFDENDIMIPFPIRTLDFGIKGGVAFKEELKASKLLTNNGSERGN
ncbi:MAG: mechanosensitive ion channel family protein [Mongoliibacter sp.]|uniref:mechanosensitive ion channel family protein n=1 Tax=Mongoliibacter sp. TaxID=2022438 RepID=UPI0012EFDD5F|nr:mechanosensitive ion channel [Mongoliibacter sp.]TVP42934.1 MAG: mechanosensitive ion channel family protein [Mongoliibacter sp.]